MTPLSHSDVPTSLLFLSERTEIGGTNDKINASTVVREEIGSSLSRRVSTFTYVSPDPGSESVGKRFKDTKYNETRTRR